MNKIWMLILLIGLPAYGKSDKPQPVVSKNAKSHSEKATDDPVKSVKVGNYDASVVIVYATQQPSDLRSPWSRRSPQTLQFLGVVVDGEYILTTAYAVRDLNFAEIRRFGENERYPVEVAFVDYEVNLALLKTSEKEAMSGLHPLEFGDLLPIEKDVTVLKNRTTSKLTGIKTHLDEVSIQWASTSSYGVVTYQFESKAASLGWAEPVIDRKGHLVALTTGQDDQGLYAIPISIIKHFIDDTHRKHYQGFPALGIEVQPLNDPYLRKYIHADSTKKGVRVDKVYENSALKDVLRENDVLLKVGNISINEQGQYNHPMWGQLPFKAFLNEKFAEEPIKLEILRDGKVETITAPLQRYDSNATSVPHYYFQHPEPHIIVGGLIFQILSTEYLMQWGRDWSENAPLSLLFQHEFNNNPDKNGTNRLVILDRVLADDINRGFESEENLILSKANGQPVHSLEDLQKALAKPLLFDRDSFQKFEFLENGRIIILKTGDLANAKKRIYDRYKLNSDAIFF